MRQLLKLIWCTILIVSLFTMSVWIFGEEVDQVKLKEFNQRIIEAQKQGDKKELQQVMKDYEQFLNQDPRIKKGLQEFKEKTNQISFHQSTAKEYLAQNEFDKALEEYKKIINLTEVSKENFGMPRALVFVEIGKIYLAQGDKLKANENFEKALVARIHPELKSRLKTQINTVKGTTEKLAKARKIKAFILPIVIAVILLSIIVSIFLIMRRKKSA